MQTAIEVLKKYWNHDNFRQPQQEIIESVLNNNDTFALMPTGGGKSICFQIPALMKPGICLVISPLVALMKDQVNNLQKRDIKAIALTGGINNDEIIHLLDNCEYGNYKFLYLSPERLQSDWIFNRICKLPINLIAIDEAHCVSQWGHDFRPAYLKISKLKDHFNKIPFLALTATATTLVKNDILKELKLNNPQVFQKSFHRENIAYMVFEVEDKLFRIEQILKKNPESSIIYVRNRKSCLEISTQLISLGFTSTYFHGGLTPKEKEKNMQLWMTNTVQVIVATNAFGMGIDKANVKTIIHIHLPENIENYYQEAGRAGRNGQKAYAVILTSASDILLAENQFYNSLPDKKFLNDVYLKLNSYFQIAYGEGINEQFTFNINHFCVRYGFPSLKTYNAIQFLDQQGVITMSKEFSEKITLQFLISSKEVIRYMSLNPLDEEIILTILRTYPGIYEMPAAFNINLIAKKSNHNESEIHTVLEKLAKKEIIVYHSKNNDTSITFNEVREDDKTINRLTKYLENQNNLKIEQLKAVLKYINETNTCKSNLILNYFGEKSETGCGICSYCISKQKTNSESSLISRKIIELLKLENLSSRELEIKTKINSNDIIFALQDLLDNNQIKILPNNKYTLLN